MFVTVVGTINQSSYDRNNWFWCPRNKNFECSKEISVESVIKTIDKLITENAIKV